MIVKPSLPSHGFQEKFVQKFVQSPESILLDVTDPRVPWVTYIPLNSCSGFDLQIYAQPSRREQDHQIID